MVLSSFSDAAGSAAAFFIALSSSPTPVQDIISEWQRSNGLSIAAIAFSKERRTSQKYLRDHRPGDWPSSDTITLHHAALKNPLELVQRMGSGVVARLPTPERNPFRASDNTAHGAKTKLMETAAVILSHGASGGRDLAWRVEPGNMLSDLLELNSDGKMVRSGPDPIKGM